MKPIAAAYQLYIALRNAAEDAARMGEESFRAALDGLADRVLAHMRNHPNNPVPDDIATEAQRLMDL